MTFTLPHPNLASRPVALPNAPMVTVEFLAEAIATALVEIPDDERLATVKKETPDGPGKWRIELLTGDDWRLIRKVCACNPPVSCSPAQFAAWRAPFDTASNRPDWDLHPEFQPSNEMRAAQSRWSLCNVQHLRQIQGKVESGEYTLITATGIETGNLYDNAGLPVGYLRIADAKAYLDKCCIDWEIASTQADTVAPVAMAPEPKTVTVDDPQKSVQAVRRYALTTTRNTPLSAEIQQAEKLAPDPNNVESVWGELTKLAEQKWGNLFG